MLFCIGKMDSNRVIIYKGEMTQKQKADLFHFPYQCTGTQDGSIGFF